MQRNFTFRSGKLPAKYTHEYRSNYWALRTRCEDIIVCQQDTSDCCHGKFTLASLLNSLFTSFLMTCSKQWFELLHGVQRGRLQLWWMYFHRLMILRWNQQQLSCHMQPNHPWIGLGGSGFCDARVCWRGKVSFKICTWNISSQIAVLKHEAQWGLWKSISPVRKSRTYWAKAAKSHSV